MLADGAGEGKVLGPGAPEAPPSHSPLALSLHSPFPKEIPKPITRHILAALYHLEGHVIPGDRDARHSRRQSWT